MIQKTVEWLDRYREVAFDLIRIYLGIGLFARGVLFAFDATTFVSLLPEGSPAWLGVGQIHAVVAVLHLLGGLCIAAGFWTRVAALVQVPILFGAVFLSLGSLFSASQSFELSSLVLFLLLLVVVCGSGTWSLDHRLRFRRTELQQLLDRLYRFRGPAFDLLRMYLGVGLLIRGVLFIADANSFMELIGGEPGSILRSTVLLHYVALSHFLGGFMLLAGLLSRVGALIQIPILVGAVFVEEMNGGLTAGTQGFEIAALTLFLLVLIFLYGSGEWSSDRYLFHDRESPPAHAVAPVVQDILDQAAPQDQSLVNPEEILAVPEALTSRESIELIKSNPHIVSQARYSFWGWAMFLIDMTPKPREIVFKDVHSGEVLRRSKDPRVLQQFRYR
ncbi:MAG: DoxX family protein [Bacteroidota bacterium]|nr:DoxX family protein [Bacteroidota bacterium]MDE2833699.1 DoxX family protein [Bacteroidota bacterium]MDE2957284.1 DoxX family protein [Bacteroidota bacterium]